MKEALEKAKELGHVMVENKAWSGPDQPHYICSECGGFISLYCGQVLDELKTRKKCLAPKKEAKDE